MRFGDAARFGGAARFGDAARFGGAADLAMLQIWRLAVLFGGGASFGGAQVPYKHDLCPWWLPATSALVS